MATKKKAKPEELNEEILEAPEAEQPAAEPVGLPNHTTQELAALGRKAKRTRNEDDVKEAIAAHKAFLAHPARPEGQKFAREHLNHLIALFGDKA